MGHEGNDREMEMGEWRNWGSSRGVEKKVGEEWKQEERK